LPALATKIAAKKAITKKDFVSQTAGHEAGVPRSNNLFSGKQVKVNGYSRFFRLDKRTAAIVESTESRMKKSVSSEHQYLTY